MRKLFTILALSLILTGCASSGLIPAGKISLGEGHGMMTQGSWSDVTYAERRYTRAVQVLSRDGPLLNQIILVRGLDAGKGLLRPADRTQPVPIFRADQTGREQVELVVETLSELGYRKVRFAQLRPASFGPDKAIRFDLTARTEDGLNLSGIAQAARVKGELYLVIFIAPSEHYFPTLKAEVEAMMNSAH